MECDINWPRFSLWFINGHRRFPNTVLHVFLYMFKTIHECIQHNLPQSDTSVTVCSTKSHCCFVRAEWITDPAWNKAVLVQLFNSNAHFQYLRNPPIDKLCTCSELDNAVQITSHTQQLQSEQMAHLLRCWICSAHTIISVSAKPRVRSDAIQSRWTQSFCMFSWSYNLHSISTSC